jgi:hypothetical protein
MVLTSVDPLVLFAQSSIGGKMIVFQNSLPSTGQGALRNRDNPRLYGTDKEHTLLQPVDTYVALSFVVMVLVW